MDSRVARCLPRHPFAKFASTKILFPRNMTNWATVGSKSSPKPARISSRASLLAGKHGGIQLSGIRSKASRGTQPPGYHSTQSAPTSAGRCSARKPRSSSISSSAISTNCPSSVPDRGSHYLAIVPFSEGVPIRARRTNLSPRFDYQVSATTRSPRATSTNVKIGRTTALVSSVSLPGLQSTEPGTPAPDQRYTNHKCKNHQ